VAVCSGAMSDKPVIGWQGNMSSQGRSISNGHLHPGRKTIFWPLRRLAVRGRRPHPQLNARYVLATRSCQYSRAASLARVIGHQSLQNLTCTCRHHPVQAGSRVMRTWRTAEVGFLYDSNLPGCMPSVRFIANRSSLCRWRNTLALTASGELSICGRLPRIMYRCQTGVDSLPK